MNFKFYINKIDIYFQILKNIFKNNFKIKEKFFKFNFLKMV